MSCALLTKSLEAEITKKLGGKTSILGNAISVAKLFVVVGQEWKDTEVSGLLVFCQERETRCLFVRIYDFSTMNLRFQAEVSYDPVFSSETEFFQTLELETTTVGFLHSHGTLEPFENSADVSTSSISEAKRFASAINRFKMGQDELKEAKIAFQANMAMAGNGGGKRRGSAAWSKFKEVVGFGGQAASATAGTVTGPTNFKHVGHVGINPDGTMDVNHCPEEWKIHLKEAKVTKKAMMDPEFNRRVVNTLKTFVPLGEEGGAPKPPPLQKLGSVLYDFIGTDAKQLTVSVGEEVLILKEYSDGWSKVERTADNKVGMVPSSYLASDAVVMVKKPAAPAPARPSAGHVSVDLTSVPPVVEPAPAPAPRAAPPPRNGLPPPPRPGSSAPPPRPGSSVPQPRPVPAVVEEVEPEYQPPEQEEEQEVVPVVEKPVNPLLAGIVTFKKTELVKTDLPVPQAPAGNPMLDAIRSGKELRKTEVVAKVSAPSLLDSIRSGKNLRKVEAPDPSTRPPVPAAHQSQAATTVGEPSLGGLFADAMAKIRSDVMGNDDDDDDNDGDNSDWD